MLEVRLLKLLAPSQRIQSIKALRNVTVLNLQEAVVIVKELEHTPGALVKLTETVDADWRPRAGSRHEFSKYFEWERVRKPSSLRLWVVTGEYGTQYLVLATTDADAVAAGLGAVGLEPNTSKAWQAREIEGPFYSGQVLGKFS